MFWTFKIHHKAEYQRLNANTLYVAAILFSRSSLHRESLPCLPNRGNFLEILHLVACHDESVKAKLVSGPRNAIYTSPDIQNSLLNIMAGMVRENICNAVREAGFFSLLADETKDVSKQEQLAIVLRYVDDAVLMMQLLFMKSFSHTS